MEETMTRAELRWLLVASLAVLLFASLPTLYAWSLADEEHVFTGFVYNTEDGNSYLAKMRLGAEGEWLFHIFYTAEAHDPAMAFPLHILLGKLAAAGGLSLVLVYHLARVVFGLLLLWTIYVFVGRFTADVTTRRVAWALAVVGSGLGWLLLLVGQSLMLGVLPLDFWVPEAFVFLVLYNLPHLAVAQSLLLWSILWTMEAFEGRPAAPILKAGLAAIGMTLVVPFYAGVLAAALGAYLLALAVKERRLPWQETWRTALVGAFAAPVVAYNAWAFTSNPAFRVWTAQNTILSPHPLHFVLGYLPLLIPAVPGAVGALRGRDRAWLLPVAWVLAVPVLLYLPFNLQRRMIAGAQVPLALLAAQGLVGWLRERSRAWRTWLLVWVAVAALSNVLLVGMSLLEVTNRSLPAFRPPGEVAAIDWLGQHAAPDDVVLSAYQSGNLIPTRAKLRVFLGHGPETLYNEEKEEAVKRFFDPAADDDWRRELLAQYHVAWVFQGPAERALGGWDPTTAQYLVPVYDDKEYALYRVDLEQGQP
jgi:hypothetical protein